MRFLLVLILCTLLFGAPVMLILGAVSLGAVVALISSHPVFLAAAALFVASVIAKALARAVR